MAANHQRRDLLGDTAIDVLADEGVHRLTHRRVDQAAGVPIGTTKNYFPTREALLLTAAERVYDRYLSDQAQLEALGGPSDREGLIALLAELIRRGTSTDRARLRALIELHAEAFRDRTLGSLLAAQTEIDFAMYDRVQRSAGLPVTTARSRLVARSMHAALVSLLAHPEETLASQGLDDLEGFAREVIDTVYPP